MLHVPNSHIADSKLRYYRKVSDAKYSLFIAIARQALMAKRIVKQYRRGLILEADANKAINALKELVYTFLENY